MLLRSLSFVSGERPYVWNQVHPEAARLFEHGHVSRIFQPDHFLRRRMHFLQPGSGNFRRRGGVVAAFDEHDGTSEIRDAGEIEVIQFWQQPA